MQNLREEIIILREKGTSYRDIAKLLNCSLSTVSNWIKKSDISEDLKKPLPRKNSYQEKIKDKTTTIPTLSEKQIDLLKKAILIGANGGDLLVFFNIKSRYELKNILNQNNIEYEKYTNTVQGYESLRKRRKVVKLLSVAFKGGVCESCGYDRCVKALEFHHLNPEEKEFSISRDITKISWVKLKLELEKCVMLCANCHREKHDVYDD